MVIRRGIWGRRDFLAGLISAFGLTPVQAVAGGQPLVELPDKPIAPDLRLPDLAGKIYDLRDYRGRVAVVNFWATWCAPCRKEMPSLQRAWRQWRRDGIVLLAVSMDRDREQVERFLRRYEVDFPILLNGTRTLQSAWQLQGMPTTYVIDRNGRIHFGAIGERSWDSRAILEQINRLTRKRTGIFATGI